MESVKMLIWNKFFLVLAIWLEQTSSVLRGVCKECLPNSVACLDELSFATCIHGNMINNLILCPDGTICTSESTVCVSSSTGLSSPACYEDNCNTCALTNGTFACLNETTYAFCYDGVNPDLSSITSCPDERVCSLESPAICVRISDGGKASCIPDGNDIPITVEETNLITEGTIEQTTTTIRTTTIDKGLSESTTLESTEGFDVITDSTAESASASAGSTVNPESSTESTIVGTNEITTTATNDSVATTQSIITTIITSTQGPPINPNVFCTELGRIGLFKDNADLTCKTYIYCYLLSGQFLGERYYCPGYFNSEQRHCQAAKPIDC